MDTIFKAQLEEALSNNREIQDRIAYSDKSNGGVDSAFVRGMLGAINTIYITILVRYFK